MSWYKHLGKFNVNVPLDWMWMCNFKCLKSTLFDFLAICWQLHVQLCGIRKHKICQLIRLFQVMTTYCKDTSFTINWKYFQILDFNPNCTGEGGNKFCHARKTVALSAAPLPDFFLWSLTNILTPSLRKSDLPLWSHMTFCDQRSTWKVRFFPILCTKQMAKWIFYFGL